MLPQKNDSVKYVWLGSFALGLLIFTFLVWWLYFKEAGEVTGQWVYFLPYLNCALNTITSCLLIAGYRAIKAAEKEKHKALMISAAATSALFLVSYLTYHHFIGDTKFMGTGFVKYVYFTILISHIFLSMVQVPCILATFFFAFTKRWDYHKKAAKLTFPVWLYVSVTGVIIFFFLKAFN